MNLSIKAEKLRKIIIEKYHIDHIVELQILIASFTETGLYSLTNENDIIHLWKFIRVFHDVWNTRIVARSENNDKTKYVGNYLQWKYGEITGDLNVETKTVIDGIFNFYKINRSHVLSNLSNDPKFREKFLGIERKLFELLKESNTVIYSQFYKNVTNSINSFVSKISEQYHMDHIVELQILAHVLTQNDVTNEMVQSKFINYFHQTWNIKIIDKMENQQKCVAITKWLKFIYNNQQRIDDEDKKIVKYVADIYMINRKYVKDSISTDKYLDPYQKAELRDTEQFLFELLKIIQKPK